MTPDLVLTFNWSKHREADYLELAEEEGMGGRSTASQLAGGLGRSLYWIPIFLKASEKCIKVAVHQEG